MISSIALIVGCDAVDAVDAAVRDANAPSDTGPVEPCPDPADPDSDGDGICDSADPLRSDWIDSSRIMVIYNRDRLRSVDVAEADTFSHDIGEWYMQRYGMPTTHLFPWDMGESVLWDNPGAFDFLRAVADYIVANDIQIVLMAPGTPLLIRDLDDNANLALDSLAGHALWFAHEANEAPTCTSAASIDYGTSNLYFPELEMGDGASPFVIATEDTSRWCSSGGLGSRWLERLPRDLRDHPSVRPYGRIGLPYYPEVFPTDAPELEIPLESSELVMDLVEGGLAAMTSIDAFNRQASRELVFFGRETNTARFIDVESSLNEAMALDAIDRGISADRIRRIESAGGWDTTTCISEPTWDHTAADFMSGSVSPPINPFIFSGGGVNNTLEDATPWPASLEVRPGLAAAVSVSNGRTFAGSLLRRGATAIVVNIHHPEDARLHAWLTVFQQLVDGATMTEAMVTSGGSDRGGYVTGSIWGDPLYAPFGLNPVKMNWVTGE